MISAFFDGCCEPNPTGPMGYGWYIWSDGRTLSRDYGIYKPKDGKGSNNVAEYAALGYLLLELRKEQWKGKPITIYGDSKLVIYQINREWQIGRGLYTRIAHDVNKLAATFTNLKYEWVPRESNEEADSLSRMAINGE